jgi:hypothetical protein
MRAKEDEMTSKSEPPADESCKCGAWRLRHCWAAVTDAGDKGTGYMRHSRQGCLTLAERQLAASTPVKVLPREDQVEAPYCDVCGDDLRAQRIEERLLIVQWLRSAGARRFTEVGPLVAQAIVDGAHLENGK